MYSNKITEEPRSGTQRCQQCKSKIPDTNQNQGIAVCELCSLIQHTSLSEWASFFGTPLEAPAKKESEQPVIGRFSNPLPYNNKLDAKMGSTSENSEATSIKDQIAALERPPTPEEKLACCMEDLNIESSIENQTYQMSSSSMAGDMEEKMTEDIFYVDKFAREKKENRKIKYSQKLF